MNNLIKVTKLRSVENPYHKNSTFGESKPFHVGVFVGEPELYEPFRAVGISFENKGIRTSPVTKIIDKQTFETLNSVYKWEHMSDDEAKTYNL